jgi:Ulp1 family protease
VLQVPQQPNYKDCACYAVFFAKAFLYNPPATMNLIKVGLVFLFFIQMVLADVGCQNPPSAADLTSQWGLKSNDITFIRREIRTTLLRYISNGDASVEYV